jgi:ribosome recycling factor
MRKEGLISKDVSRDNQLEIQKFTDKYISLIETKLSEKEKEILKV